MIDDDSRADIKRRAIGIVAQVEPGDEFVVEDGFDALIDDWDQAKAPDEGRFGGTTEAASFAGLVVPFLLGFIGDVAKDVVKDQAKKAVGALIDKLLARKATTDDAAELKSAVESAIVKSRFSNAEKLELSGGFDKLFDKIRQDRDSGT
ncbi:hypothetical protein A9R05_32980 (plasmid) [Burkholderia sp. KK1]|nr:hypothetical protein A9R05_32980 [Burkholderia sp. KK1]